MTENDDINPINVGEDVNKKLMEESNEEDNDVVELEGVTTKAKKVTTKRKRQLRSTVWAFFEMLPVGDDNKRKCKCKKYGITYVADSKFGTGNMKRHM